MAHAGTVMLEAFLSPPRIPFIAISYKQPSIIRTSSSRVEREVEATGKLAFKLPTDAGTDPLPPDRWMPRHPHRFGGNAQVPAFQGQTSLKKFQWCRSLSQPAVSCACGDTGTCMVRWFGEISCVGLLEGAAWMPVRRVRGGLGKRSCGAIGSYSKVTRILISFLSLLLSLLQNPSVALSNAPFLVSSVHFL